jgi:flotillin
VQYVILFGILVMILTAGALVRRYKRCPSDQILVVYGKVAGSGRGGVSARCFHGGAAFIVPVFQDYQFLDLTPMTIDIKLEGALSKQNIRVNCPSSFTIGISTESGVMENAAERLLGMPQARVADLARDIIFGQMRVTLATMPIEEINADRDKLIDNITNGVEVELKKVGLRLINVNIQDITDESGYIDALGKEAAARAINEAKVKVSEQERDGAIGSANAERDRRISVAEAQARAVEGENISAISIAQSLAKRREQEAEAERLAAAAEKVKSANALREAYVAEEEAERQRAAREEATQRANVVVPVLIEKERIQVLAEAEAEKIRRLKKGEADGILFRMEAEAAGQLANRRAEADGTKLQMEAEAAGTRARMLAEAEGLIEVLRNKALGFERMIAACGGDTERAALLLITEQLPRLIEEQVKAIANLKIDSVTVWEGGRNGNGKGSTADFAASLVGALPPLHDLAGNVGIKLPEFLGRLRGHDESDEGTAGESAPKAPKSASSAPSPGAAKREPPDYVPR